MRSSVTAAAMALVLGAAAVEAQGEPRLALLIGNAAYGEHIGALARPHEDVGVLDAALREAGFRTTIIRDADETALLEAVTGFAQALGEAGDGAVGFLYFAGQGAGVVNADGHSTYLIPTDARALDPNRGVTGLDVRRDGVAFDDIMGELSGAMGGLNDAALFVIVDASRHALTPEGADHAGGSGFAPIPAPPGVFIAFSTADGLEASDDGVYAEALAAQLTAENQFASRAFTLAAREVAAQRGYDARRPMAFDALTRNVCFVSCPDPAASLASNPPAAEMTAFEAFTYAENENTVAAWEWFLERHGNTPMVYDARAALEDLRAETP